MCIRGGHGPRSERSHMSTVCLQKGYETTVRFLLEVDGWTTGVVSKQSSGVPELVVLLSTDWGLTILDLG